MGKILAWMTILAGIATIVGTVYLLWPESVSLTVKAHTQYTPPPEPDENATCGGNICRFKFAPIYQFVNTSSQDIIINNLLFRAQNTNQYEIRSANRPSVTTAPGFDELAEEDKDKIAALSFPIHVAPHSQILVRADFRLQCFSSEKVQAVANKEHATKLIPVCFGMEPEEEWIRRIPHRLDVVVGEQDQIQSYSFSELILFTDKKLKMPETKLKPEKN